MKLDLSDGKVLIGVIHLPPLPGSPRFRGGFQPILDRAVADALAYQKGGASAVILENFGDIPFTAGSVAPETIAAMARAGAAVLSAIRLPMGYNVLRNDARAALGLAAAVEGSFIRVNVHTGAMLTDQGIIQGNAYDTVRARQHLCPGTQIFADVHVKHAVPLSAELLEDAARDAWERGQADALIISGAGTGLPALAADVETVRAVCPDAPVLIGSGFNLDNAREFLPLVNGAIVGSSLKKNDRLNNPVDPARVKNLVRAMQGFRVARSLKIMAIALLCCLSLATRADDEKKPAPAESHKAEPAKKTDSTNAPPEKKEGSKAGPSDKKDLKDELSETTNSVTINGATVNYKATAGTLVIKDEEGKAHVSFFFVAYTSLDATNAPERPVTFSFNGGPGSSSVWLHLGVLGPRRVFLKEDGSLPPPPFHLVDNEYSLLDQSDLVFIDPVSTGYSRTVAGEDPHKYHGVDQDLQSVGDFIRLYTTRYQRWNSPKFLIGESYGTTRAAGLSGYLENRFGMYLNGIALVSSILDFSTISFNAGNDLPYVLYLPTETAVAWFHKKLPPDLQSDRKKALKESEQYALGDYSRALMQGSTLSPADRQRVIKEVARLTGLSEDYVDRANLRVHASRFFKELLRKERLIIGRYDGRLTGPDPDATGEFAESDPSFTSVLGPFTATLNDYVRRELKFESDLPYEVLTGKVQPWDYSEARNHYLDVAETLGDTMKHNPYLKVFVANGYYDLATPYLATRYTFNHLDLPASLQTNVSMGYYDAGHMMYVNQPSLMALKQDLARFIRAALPAK